MKKTIYVSIASFMDKELKKTVVSLLSNARNPENIFLYILSQDNVHPDLEKILKRYEVLGYKYEKVLPESSKGVGHARYITRSFLSKSYTYYLQIDSHSIFEWKWDVKLIRDYEKAEKKWERFIFTSYPPGYDYIDGFPVKTSSSDPPPIVGIRPILETPTRYEPKYIQYSGDEYGQETGYFCGGLGFGRSEHFLQVPYDPEIYFNGEEQTQSIRFFENGIKLVCPPNIYLYHNYNGDMRQRHWQVVQGWENLDKLSQNRLNSFFTVSSNSEYSLKSLKSISLWEGLFVNVP
jgi:hypothetical protein